MACFQAFRCIHPATGLEADIAALPYDVYNRKEAGEAVKGRPHSFLRIDRAETQFAEEIDIYDKRVYEKARELLWGMVEQGQFVEEQEPAYYVYELTMEGRSQTGIVGCASIDDYVSGVIKKHENTRAEKEQDRICHVDTCKAQTGPVFLAYREDERITDVVEAVKAGEPMFDFVAEDGIRHRGWKIAGAPQIWVLSEAFYSLGGMYIADGHHRAASAVRVGLNRREEQPDYTGQEEFNYFLAVAFPDAQLHIMDYNRVVKDLNGLREEEFLAKVGEKFEIEKVSGQMGPAHKGEFTMFLGEQWYYLKAKPEIMSEDPVDGLDVSVLQDALLGPILGIGDPRRDTRIDFIGGIRGLQELERRVRTDMQVAFAMYPTSMKELFDVADAGLLMPPKSTWFEPKLRSGLFIHAIG